MVLVSQAAFSLGNLALLVAVSRSGGTTDLGRIAIVLICFQISLGLTRALLGEVALVRTAAMGRLQPDEMLRSSLVAGTAVGLALMVIGAASLNSVVVLGLFMPLLATQDSLRYVSFAERRAQKAARGDASWLLSFVTFVAVVEAAGRHPSVGSTLLIWCLCGAASAAVIDPRALLRALGARSRWIRESRRIALVYLPDFAITLALAALPSLFVAGRGGLSEVGSLRLALSYLGPISVVWTAVVNVATPTLAGSRRSHVRIETRLAFGAVVAVTAWTAIGVAAPSSIMQRLVGESWSSVRSWVLWLSTGFITAASYSGAIVGLRARDRAREAFLCRLWTTPLALLAPAVGFEFWGKAGFGIGMAVAAAATSLSLWRALLRAASPGHNKAELRGQTP